MFFYILNVFNKFCLKKTYRLFTSATLITLCTTSNIKIDFSFIETLSEKILFSL